jgi:hypothetical protein
MTENDIKRLLGYEPFDPVPITVRTTDYAYDGWIVGWGERKNRRFHVMVEDEFGRLNIHPAAVVRKR